MEKDPKLNSFKKLLDRLQEDSWQLELLISGFAIFGLFYALEPVTDKLRVASYNDNTVFINLLVVVLFALKILIFNLLLHVLLRALWIGSLGLRYVFGDIDYEQLNYSELFTNYLKRKVGSFDDYIGKLENICSIIFAISFLLIFYLFAFFIISFILIAFNVAVSEPLVYLVQLVFGIFAFGIILIFIDFITQGLLKKNKWIAKIYFPFYWFFSIITLSFIYRPLVYNLLDNKKGRRISLALIPIYLLIYIGFNLQFQKSNFITQKSLKLSSNRIASGGNYQDIVDSSKDLFMGDFTIQSKVITDSYIKLSIPLNSKIEDSLVAFNPKLKPEKDERGLYFQSDISVERGKKYPVNFDTGYLQTLDEYYIFKIDGIRYKTEFVVTHNSKMITFESNIGIQKLSEGKHTAEFLYREPKGSMVSIRKIPFWYYKN